MIKKIILFILTVLWIETIMAKEIKIENFDIVYKVMTTEELNEKLDFGLKRASSQEYYIVGILSSTLKGMIYMEISFAHKIDKSFRTVKYPINLLRGGDSNPEKRFFAIPVSNAFTSDLKDKEDLTCNIKVLNVK
jgi:hypothetical protein